jgi:hypothetical protein
MPISYPRGCGRSLSKQVPTEVRATLAAEIEGSTAPVEDLGAPPPQLERWRVLLEDALGSVVRLASGSGPSYLIEPGVSFRSSAELIRSDTGDASRLRAAALLNIPAHELERAYHALSISRHMLV